MSSLSPANGSEEKICKVQVLSLVKMWKVRVADLVLPFTKKITIKFGIWEGHLNTILAPGGRNVNNLIFKSLNHRGVVGGGRLKLRIDQRVNREEVRSIID